MAAFDITTKPTSLNLKPAATGSIMVVVSNRTGRPLLGRVDGELTSAAAANWLVAPPPDQLQRHYEIDATASLEFKVAVPTDAAAQNVQFNASVHEVGNSDDTMVRGQTVDIKVIREDGVIPKKGVPWWVWVIVAAVVVVGVGVGIYFVVRPKPDSTVRLGPIGGDSGKTFADSCDELAEVHVREGYVIDAIQLVCTGPSAQPRRGGPGGGEGIFQLQPGERITAVSGSAMAPGQPFVFSIQLHTDQRSSPEFGNQGPTKGQIPFKFVVPTGAASVDFLATRDSSSMRLAS